jgi:hypothetical protein
MPDIYIERHGDRWAIKDDPDGTPFFESYTREEALSAARLRARGGEVIVTGDETGEIAQGQVDGDAARAPESHEFRDSAASSPDDELRKQQGGL